MRTRAVLIAVFIAMSAWPAHAQSLGIAPGQITQTFKPGVPFELTLNVANYGTDAVELSGQITDFWFNDKNEKVFPPPGTSPRSAANWIQFVPEHFDVGPNAVQKMKVIVTPPADAVGGYYAALFVESKPAPTNKKSKDGHAVFTNLRLGCLLLLSTAENQKYDVAVSDPRILLPSANQELTATFDVDNRSNTHIFAAPRLAILNSSRKLISKAQTPEKRYLPGQKDAMTVKWSGSLPPGDYTAVVTVVYASDHVETRQTQFRIP